MTKEIDRVLAARARSIIKAIEDVQFISGVKVRLLVGKYKGREGVLSGIIADEHHGLLYLIMVLKKGKNELLNSDAESRMYRPREDFEFIVKSDVRENDESKGSSRFEAASWRTRRKQNNPRDS